MSFYAIIEYAKIALIFTLKAAGGVHATASDG